MAELIDKGALIADFNNSGIHIEFDFPVEEVLGEDVDINDFTMLVQGAIQAAIQAYRKMVIGTIQKQSTTTEAEIRAKAIDDFAEKLSAEYSENFTTLCSHGVKFDVLAVDSAINIMLDLAEQLKGE